MIVKDHAIATLVAAALTIGSILTTSGAASADSGAAPAAPAAGTPFAVATVTLTLHGHEAAVVTAARTVGEFLAERDIHPGAADSVSAGLDAPIVDGMSLTVGDPAPATGGDVVAPRVGPRDALSDERTVAAAPDADYTTATVRSAHPAFASRHARPKHRLTALRRTPVRVAVRRSVVAVRRPPARVASSALAARIFRPLERKSVVRGVGTYDALAHVAAQGFASAVHFAGSALHMIATAYTAGCYACSGVTASGVRAGFGIIAVDPHVIPLGTKLFIPGYGHAVAGDTGGAILGNRVDLGFDNNAQAMQFGRRAITVYVLR